MHLLLVFSETMLVEVIARYAKKSQPDTLPYLIPEHLLCFREKLPRRCYSARQSNSFLVTTGGAFGTVFVT